MEVTNTGPLRSEMDTVKIVNKSLMVQNCAYADMVKALQANNAELRAKLEVAELKANNRELQHKLEMAELKSKLSNEQTANQALEAKLTDLTGNLAEKLMSKTEEKIATLNREMSAKVELLTSKMAEDGDKLLKEVRDEVQWNQQKFGGQLEANVAEKDKQMKAELDKLAKQFHQGTADLKGTMAYLKLKMMALECQDKEMKAALAEMDKQFHQEMAAFGGKISCLNGRMDALELEANMVEKDKQMKAELEKLAEQQQHRDID